MKHVFAVCFCLWASASGAQQFTSAAEVRPILTATKGSWVAVREYNGQDLLYFTHLLAWRCGLTQIAFSVNGGALQVFPAEPCYEGTAQPNAIKAEQVLPYAVAPLGSIAQVSVQITYDDGTADSAGFERAAILMP